MELLKKILTKQESIVPAVLNASIQFAQGSHDHFSLSQTILNAVDEDSKQYHSDDDKLHSWSNRVIEHYCEPARAYHTLTHILSMMWFYITNYEHTGLSEDSLNDYAAVHFCIFHDIIYDPKATGGANETLSKDVFEEFLQDLGLDQVETLKQTHEFISDSIVDTIKHQKHDCEDQLSTLNGFLLDCDLSVLSYEFESEDEAAEPNLYMSYARNIRKEYIHIDYDTYCEARAGVMKKFLAKEFIYFTPKIIETCEQIARENIEKEIKILEEKVI
ncbi:unnamed protein product [Moneuplotes crassus]|uniref:Uncharacterized protein n=1 Tax=Euplotes crassus TaxID=5936 RepID=A0AAD1XTE1_EUPCR|nr:unnamed protein product [Moneuplotes crassus]